eukprot:TRINITY_DN75298_c0_g1_i1.p2 TRINITY_DN75298_c0_g1~~TRINITY_DN75298_c0_g1_i1.p2  ORF type:complete len:141 (-),score=86.09 TRINITY_DN75298_c0_g1_i1:344-766(-)
MSVSNDLVWELTKKQNAFLVKRNGKRTVFSRHPQNVTNKHSYKTDGLSNSRAVGVTVVNKKITLTLKKKNGAVAKTQLNRHMVNGACRAANVIRGATQKSFYRADLADAAVARYHALKRSTKAIKNGGVNAKKDRRRAKN